MASVSFIDEDSIKQAIQLVRKDTDECNWCAVTYENSKSTKLQLCGQGNDGLDGLTQVLKPEICVYAILCVHDRPDELVEATTKFVFIIWIGTKVARMQRARQGVALSSIQEIFGSCHITINCEELNEITLDIVMNKVRDASGSAVHVIGKDGSKAAPLTANVGPRAKITNSVDIVWNDEEAVKQAISNVRNDSEPTTWVFVTYDDQFHLGIAGQGNGTVNDEIAPLLKPEVAGYGLVRKTEQIDDSETVKFAYFIWIGESIDRRLRSQLSTHQGKLDQFFAPHHVTIEATEPKEVTDEIVVDTISKASGTKSNVLDSVVSGQAYRGAVRSFQTPTKVQQQSAPVAEAKPIKIEKKEPAEKKTPVKTVASTEQSDGPKIEDIDAIQEAISDIRNDSTETKWMFMAYNDKKQLQFIQKGEQGLDEMLPLFTDKVAGYALVRRTLQIDDSETVKFVKISWTGENIPRMLRAKLGIYEGTAAKILSPYHCELKATNLDEISENIITDAISTYAGAKSHVIANN